MIDPVWIVPGIAVAAIIGNGVVMYRAVDRHEKILTSHQKALTAHAEWIAVREDREKRP